MIPFWPLNVLEPESPNWGISGGIRTSGANGEGWAQTMGTLAGGFWTLTMGRIVITEPDQVRSWRSLRTSMRNGARPCIISIPDYACAPYPAGYPIPTLSPFGDDSTFSDESMFNSGLIEVVAAEAALRRAVFLKVTAVSAAPLRAGLVFSVIDEWGLPRRHETGPTYQTGPNAYTMEINPPLRSALAVGKRLNFDNPALVVKLSNPESIFGPMVGSRIAEISPQFVEYFGRTQASDL